MSERILFYTGRIKTMHEVKGGGDIGATMDSMELERERGITIRSAATFCQWGDHHMNLIDTPGHVDFTIEVERSLRVLDGAVLLLCGVGGVQSQTLTVDRQMRRYSVPRIAFINKLDRDNANPQKAVKGLKERLKLCCAPLQVPIGLCHEFEGVIDIIEEEAVFFDGKSGETVRRTAIPSHLAEDAAEARRNLIATLSDADSEIEDLFLNEKTPSKDQLYAAIRRATIANKFVPILMGSAYKNKGVQLLLDAVTRFLPCPLERKNTAYKVERTVTEEGDVVQRKGEIVSLVVDDEQPLVAMIFKLEETPGLGLCNYVRVYQGRLRRGDQIINVRTGGTAIVQKLVRMSANAAVQTDEIKCGEICAIVGEVEASSGDSILKPAVNKKLEVVACEDMYIPPRVLTVAVKGKDQEAERQATKRLTHFMREDPTFNMRKNPETQEIILEGMGELHIDIYVERLKRENNIVMSTGKPTVNYREVIQKSANFDFLYKRQSGGQGQWAHIKGTIEPLPIDMSTEGGTKNRLFITCSSAEIRDQLQKSIQKQVEGKIFPKGLLMNAPLWGVKITITSGAMHEVDSTDIAFRNATQEMWERYLPELEPTLVEPVMNVEIRVPANCLQSVMQEFASREGVVLDTVVDDQDATIRGETNLDSMFGFVIDLRKATKGQGEFSMEFKEYRPMAAFKAQKAMDERNSTLGRKAPIALA